MSTTAAPDRPKGAPPAAKPGILDIQAYKPGKSQVDGVADPIKLSANENILGCSPDAKAAYRDALESLNIYPDSRATALRAAIAKRYDLEPERLVFGCGTDELLHLINQVFLEPGDNIVQGEYGFGAYGIGARACQAEVRIAEEPSYRIDIDKMLGLVDERTKLVFITNPANPTGTFTTEAELRELHARLPSNVVLVIDAAYAEFCSDPTFTDGLPLARNAANIIVTHTFSKLHGLATLRVGWAYAPTPIADALDRIRPPFNIGIPGLNAAVAALADEDFQKASFDLVERWRAFYMQQLGGIGLAPVPSAANFVLVGFPKTPGKTAAEAEAYLAQRGYIVRGVANYGLPDHIRITIGLEEHNRAVVDHLTNFMKA